MEKLRASANAAPSICLIAHLLQERVKLDSVRLTKLLRRFSGVNYLLSSTTIIFPIRPENHPAAVGAVGKVGIQRLFPQPFGRRILRDRRDASARRRPFVSDAGIPASPSPRCAPRSARKADRRDRGY